MRTIELTDEQIEDIRFAVRCALSYLSARAERNALLGFSNSPALEEERKRYMQILDLCEGDVTGAAERVGER